MIRDRISHYRRQAGHPASRLPEANSTRLAVRLLATTSLTVALCAGSPASKAVTCTDEPNTTGSVEGLELSYDLDTAYTAEWERGRADWNALGEVDIRPDDSMASADVRVTDVNRADVSWSGMWEESTPGADDIVFNAHFLANYLADTRRGVVTHEIGHALKLGHVADSGTVMYCNDSRTAYSPSPADIAAYQRLWG